VKVLVTGDRGYIGCVLVRELTAAGHEVAGADAGFFDECTIDSASGGDAALPRRDIRDLTIEELDGFEAVVHLAALSNDPMGDLNPAWTRQVNLDASARLARLAREAGVRRFLFSSSCIMYGMSEAADVSETSPLSPQTDYARSKVAAEAAISALADERFCPVFLRNGTVYGPSPRMRFDTVLNNLVGSAVATGRVVVQGDGEPWRPVVDVRDVARAFVHLLEAPDDAVRDEAFNVGADHLNFQVRQLADAAVDAVPGSRITVLEQPHADRRTYRASFAKFARTFPEFEFEWEPRAGARDLAAFLHARGVTEDVFRDRRFTRLSWLQALLDAGVLDGSLRRQDAVRGEAA
jgi:nucleoside-diphosphate-sugar epimerase